MGDHLDYLLEGGYVAHASSVSFLMEASATALISNELPLNHLATFDEQIRRVRVADHATAAALVIGAAIHWSVLVVITDGQGALEVLYCDSQNSAILGLDQTALS